MTRRCCRVRPSWVRALTYVVLPAIALLLAGSAGWLKWQGTTHRTATAAGVQAVQAASDSAVAMLSYRADTVENDLGEADDHMTDEFRDSFMSLARDVVIPAAKQERISSVVDVPAAAVVSATKDRAVVLLSINQTVTVGAEALSGATSSVRVTLDKVGDRWLVSDFIPV